MRHLTRRAALVAAAALSLAGASPVAAQNFRVHTGAPGNSTFVFTTTLQTIVQRETPYVWNVTSGMTATRSTLDASKGEVDFFTSAPAINHYMKTGTAMYKDMADAPELFKKIRSVVNFPLGPYHVVTYADSGIDTLEDIRGKRVFVGPPGGAATTVGLAIIESTTGMVPGDYEQAKLDWTSGIQALQDRQVVLAILPTELPSPSIQQIALLSEIKLIGLTDEAMSHGPLKDMLEVPGRTVETIPAHTYGDNQMNTEDVKAVGSWVGIGTHADEPEDVVYNTTKAIFDHLDEIHGAAEWMKAFNPETALEQMNAPLHVGALRWYRENGYDVPEDLIPPEAK